MTKKTPGGGNTQIVVKNQVILNLIQDLQRLLLSFVNGVRGRSRIKYGMTALFNNGGFTLIELLVVVLIIGILAAVAVPQYQKAVVKSRVGTILPVLSSMIQAQEVYYLENGEYTDNAALLDLQPPASCTEVENDSESGTWKCGNDWLLDMDAGRIYANYCPKYNNSYTECKTKREIVIVFGASHLDATKFPGPNSKRCVKPINSPSDYGREVCKTLGRPLPDNIDWYEL